MKLSKQTKALLYGTCLISLLLLPACANDTQSSAPEESLVSDTFIVSDTSVSSMTALSETSSNDFKMLDDWTIGANMNLFMPGGGIPIDQTVLEYDGKTPMEFVLKTSVNAPNLPSNEPIKLRIWVVQQGELLEYTFEEGGTQSLYHDVFVESNTEFSTSIYFTPICETEFTPITVLCHYLPDNIPTTRNGNHGVTLPYCKMIRTTARGIAPISVPEENYIPLPENVIKYGDGEGVYIGGALNPPSSYSVNDAPMPGEEKILSADDIYLKANINDDHIYYAMIFVDGMPIKAFDGKYSLAVNFEGGTRTLNQKLNIPDGLTGAHSFFAAFFMYDTDSDCEPANRVTSHIRINITSE